MNNLAQLAVFVAIGSAIYWMVVGWRAMRAHEKIADALDRAADKFRE